MTRPARAERTYRRLLILLPRGLRREAQADLLDVFRDAHARAASGGPAARARFWIRMTANLLAASAAERASAALTLTQGAIRMPSIPRLVADLRVAVRRLSRSPGWTLGSAGTLALGLSAGIVALVLVRDILLQPLAFPRADRLVRLREIDADGGCCWYPSFPNAADWREHAAFFSGVGIADIPRVTPVGLDGAAVRVSVSRAARGLFATLGVQPIAGRFFTDDENRPGGAAVAIVSERFWRGALASAAPGTAAVTIAGQAYTVVGVLPRTFRFLGDGAAWTDPADIWTPMDRDTDLGSRTSHGYHVVARLRDGITLDRARAEMNQLAQALLAQHKEPTQAHSIQMVPLQELVVGKAREPLRLLVYGAAGVLLIACLNLAAAVLAMGIGRARELSVRLALGATRWTLARLLLVEAQTLALPGAALGLALAALAFQAIRAAGAGDGALPRLDEVHLDAQALTIALGLALVTATVAGLIPAIALSRKGLVDRLRTHGATTRPRDHQRVWTAFLVIQAALTVLLLAGTGLLVRSFVKALHVNLGYDARQVLAVDVGLPSSYESPARKVAYYDAALAALRGTPGIVAAGVTSVLPYETSAYTSGAHRERPDATSKFAGYRMVDPGYFDAIGIPRLSGDDAGFRAGGALVDRTLQNALWNGASPIGDRMNISFSDHVLTVSGVVGAIREWDQEDAIGVVYVDYHQRPAALDTMHVVVRYAGPVGTAVQGVRAAMASADRLVPVTIEPLEARATASLGDRRLVVLLAGGFGLIALLLSAAGVHAMVAFAVARQRREAAIRLALGAPPADLLRRMAGRGVGPAAAGIVAGLALAVPLGRVMAAQLFHVTPSDPVAIGAAGLGVLLAAAGASLLPARRASRVDPAVALRQD